MVLNQSGELARTPSGLNRSRRHQYSKVGALVDETGLRAHLKDKDGEYFDIRCQEGPEPEVADVRPRSRHLLLMIRDGRDKLKYLCGHDERHWFAAAVP